MTDAAKLVLVFLVAALAEVIEVLEGTRRWAVLCADNAVVLPCLPDGAVDVTLTDPPYSEHVHGKSRRGSSAPDARGEHPGGEKSSGACISRAVEFGFDALGAQERAEAAAQFARLTRRWVLAFSDLEMAGEWRSDLIAAGLEAIRFGLWIKVGCTPQFTGDRPAVGAEAINIAHTKGRKRWNGGGSHAVWSHPIVLDRSHSGSERVHTTQKPLSLMLELVELFTDPDELVLDPFAGSGTTGVACLRLGRRFIGIERDAKYAAVARERLEAESSGLTLRAARAGQIPLFGSAS